jgi:hypothetical protein
LGETKGSGSGCKILRVPSILCLVATALFTTGTACAQSSSLDDGSTLAEPPSLVASVDLPSAPITLTGVTIGSKNFYVKPTESQKFRNYAWNAVGPVAFAGSSFAAAIDQSFNFPHEWGQGMDAYGARVASNLGISLVTATAQYSIAEAFHEDTAYYRCTCTGFFPRFWHAAISTVASRRGDDGHRFFSPALTISPFIGPLVAANTWIPSHDGLNLGFHMGEHNLLGQFGQDEALEFFYGGPNTLLGRIQRRLFKKSSGGDENPD